MRLSSKTRYVPRGVVPHEYKALPAQMAMFNAFEGLTDTVERIAAFPMAGEGVADYLIAKSLKAGTVPKWITEPYQKIHDDEEEHGNYPFEILVKYATMAEKQESAARAVAMSLVLRRQYFDNLDRWVYEGKATSSFGLRMSGKYEWDPARLLPGLHAREVAANEFSD